MSVEGSQGVLWDNGEPVNTNSFLLLVVMPGAPSSDALVTSSFLLLVVMPGATVVMPLLLVAS